MPSPDASGLPLTLYPVERVGGLKSRADLEKEFRQAVVKLERIIKEHMPWGHKETDQRTLGYLIRECKEAKLLEEPELQEAFFVNTVRKSLYHPNQGEVSDKQLARAIESANELYVKLDY